MAIDIEQTITDAITAPKSVTNAAGETFVGQSAADIIALIDRLAAQKSKKRPPFWVTRAVPPGTVGPRTFSDDLAPLPQAGG